MKLSFTSRSHSVRRGTLCRQKPFGEHSDRSSNAATESSFVRAFAFSSFLESPSLLESPCESEVHLYPTRNRQNLPYPLVSRVPELEELTNEASRHRKYLLLAYMTSLGTGSVSGLHSIIPCSQGLAEDDTDLL